MGMTSAAKLRRIVKLAELATAIELLAGAQALGSRATHFWSRREAGIRIGVDRRAAHAGSFNVG